jgi:hypothetical protein
MPLRLPWPAVALLVGSVLLLGAALAVFSGPGQVRDGGVCREVTSSSCWPVVELVHAALGEQIDEIASIRGPYCGEAACNHPFGATLARLEVTFYDGSRTEFYCWQQIESPPACERVST